MIPPEPTGIPEPSRGHRRSVELPPGVETHALGRVWLDAAGRELERVHRRELARLLRQAAALSAARLEAVVPFPLRRPSIRLWRRRVRTTLVGLEDAGLEPGGARLLAALAEEPSRRWPGVVLLSRAARRVEDGELARVCLGYALLCEGEPGRAQRIFAGLLENEATLRHRWRILEGLALAHEALGRPLLALGAIEAAADEPLCGISTLVNGLHLALLAGDVERAERAAARLDLLADPYSPEFSAAVRLLRNRVDARARGAPWQPDVRTKSLFHALLRDGRSAAGRVCRALT